MPGNTFYMVFLRIFCHLQSFLVRSYVGTDTYKGCNQAYDQKMIAHQLNAQCFGSDIFFHGFKESVKTRTILFKTRYKNQLKAIIEAETQQFFKLEMSLTVFFLPGIIIP